VSDDRQTPQAPDDEEDLVQVFSTASMTEGQIAKGLLETDGISVWLKGPGEDPYPTAGSFLFVAPEDEAKAREILKDVAEGDFEGAGDTEATPEEN